MGKLATLYATMWFFIIPIGTVHELHTCWESMGWYYYPDSVFIHNAYICDGLSTKDTLRAKYHETGHYIWFNILTTEQRNKWKELYKEGNFVSQYAETSPEEDFAETYTIFMIEGKLEPKFNSKQEFLRNIN